jgi:hypothetical protein
MDLDGPVPGIPGARIRRVDTLPAELPDAVPAGQNMYAKPGQLLIAQPGIGRFLARDGTAIEVAAEAGADPGVVSLLLHGSARGALIHQRGELPLHAATLAPPGADWAVAICGASGDGKSTLAAELSKRGWMLVADDTTRITWSETHPLAWPSRDSIKLWRDVCEIRGLDVSKLERVALSMDKYYLRVPALTEPVRLAAVFELAPEKSEMPAVEKMSLLTRHTFRPAQIRPLGRVADYVRIVGQVAGSCRLSCLGAARSQPVGALADVLEETAYRNA